MKTSIFEVAQKLAEITNRSIEDFYEPEENKGQEEDRPSSQCETKDDAGEAADNTDGSVSQVSDQVQDDVERFKGELSDNGKIINFKNNMSRKEYLSLTKKLTRSEILRHPLLYVMFRSEEQGCAFFHEWIESFKEEQ